MKTALQSVNAIVEIDGSVRLMQPLRIAKPTSAIVTLLLSEEALDDWNRPEEELAWHHLQTTM